MPLISSLPYHTNSEALFESIQHLPFACWLDSGKPYSHSGRFDIMSALPSARLICEKNTTKIYRRNGLDFVDNPESIHSGDPFKVLEAELSKLESSPHSVDIPFTGGAIGYFSYNLNHGLNKIKSQYLPSNCLFADSQLGIYHWAIIQDHQNQSAYLTQLESCDQAAIDLVKQCITNRQNKTKEPLSVESLQASITQEEYLKQLKSIQDYILAGDCYQVNFAQCFKGKYSGDPYSAYGLLRKTMASPFSAYLSLGDQTIMSLSPERFLKTSDREVLAQPIKGTAPRHKTNAIDQHNADELKNSEKNKAENLMIVDLLRNDIGQHCKPGSIHVDKLFDLQSFPNVHHLVSDIKGTLKDSSSSIDLFKDCFPGGSITGAPKKRAMEIIDELETEPRGVYCGSIAYINANGDLDSNIAIRTVSCDGETLHCWGGGGIVADSIPSEEYQESLDKIKSILKVLSDS